MKTYTIREVVRKIMSMTIPGTVQIENLYSELYATMTLDNGLNASVSLRVKACEGNANSAVVKIGNKNMLMKIAGSSSMKDDEFEECLEMIRVKELYQHPILAVPPEDLLEAFMEDRQDVD